MSQNLPQSIIFRNLCHHLFPIQVTLVYRIQTIISIESLAESELLFAVKCFPNWNERKRCLLLLYHYQTSGGGCCLLMDVRNHFGWKGVLKVSLVRLLLLKSSHQDAGHRGSEQ